MVKVNRGDTGEMHSATIHVAIPAIERGSFRVNDDITIICDEKSKYADWGFPISISMNHDEALKFCSDLLSRIAMRVSPPKLPDRKPLKIGKPMLKTNSHAKV